MRRLLPPADGSTALTDDDLLREYAYPVGTSWLRANMVGSIDGVATVDGLSDGLSGTSDKRVFGLLRALADVVIAGAGTARTENYRGARIRAQHAAMRAALGQSPVPPIALISRSLGLDPKAAVFTDTSVRTIVITCANVPDDRLATVSEVADVIVAGDTKVDLAAARTALEERGLTRQLCEGGPSLLHDLVADRVLDELCLTSSPRIVGGGERHVVNGLPLTPPVPARLAGLLEDDSILFTRYVMER